MNETKRKTVEEVCPIFRTILLDANQVTKLYLLGICGLRTADEGDWPDVETTLERYMAQKSGILYWLGDNTECTPKELESLRLQSNGMPSVKMTEEDTLACKSILYCSMSNDEKSRFEYIKKLVKDNFYKYYELRHAIERYPTRDVFNEEEYRFIKQARACGWFTDVPQPDEAEKKFFGIKAEEKKKDQESRKGKKILGLFNQNSPIGTAFGTILKENGIEDTKEFFDSVEVDGNDPISSMAKIYSKMLEIKAEKKEVKKEEPPKKHFIITEEMMKTAAADEKVAAFGKEFAEKISDSRYQDVRDTIIDASIDMVGSLLKASVIKDTDEFKKRISDIDTDVIIDINIDGLNGLKDLITIIFEMIGKIKKANDLAEILNLINEMIGKIKKNSKVFTSSKFLGMISDLYGNKSNEVEIVSVKNESNPAGFTLKPFIDTDDGKPGFCNGNLPAVVKTQEKDKPEFIQAANGVVVDNQKNTGVITSYIEETLKAKEPWLQNIAAIAARNGIAVTIVAIPGTIINNDGGSEYSIVGCQISSSNNGIFNSMKSFSIDFGNFIDRRYKTIFNAVPSGFQLFDKMESAYTCFKDPKNKILEEDLFNKIFATGVKSINDADNKKWRIIYSNLCQLNRVIETITLPTNLAKHDRLAIRDSAFKLMQALKQIQRDNGVEFGRFRVTKFDKDNMSYELSNEGTYLFGELNTAPRMKIVVTLHRDNNGNVKLDKLKKPMLTFDITELDNVYDMDTFKYPDGSTIVIGESDKKIPNTNPEEIQDLEPVEEEGETPKILQQ